MRRIRSERTLGNMVQQQSLPRFSFQFAATQQCADVSVANFVEPRQSEKGDAVQRRPRQCRHPLFLRATAYTELRRTMLLNLKDNSGGYSYTVVSSCRCVGCACHPRHLPDVSPGPQSCRLPATRNPLEIEIESFRNSVRCCGDFVLILTLLRHWHRQNKF